MKGNLGNMMKQAQMVQENMRQMQEKLATISRAVNDQSDSPFNRKRKGNGGVIAVKKDSTRPSQNAERDGEIVVRQFCGVNG